MVTRFFIALLFFMAALQVAAPGGAVAADGASLAQQRDGRFVSIPCWYDFRIIDRIKCGYLVVPESWDNPGLQLHLPVMILMSKRTTRTHRLDPKPNDEPLLVLNGGPGSGNAIWHRDDIEIWNSISDGFQANGYRDIIVFTQRGTDNPEIRTFSCPEMDDPMITLGASLTPGGETDWRVSMRAALTQCKNRVEEFGHNPLDYSSMSNVRDVAALKKALGIDKWSLYGISYGARLALEIMHHTPEGLVSAILDSPDPPDNEHPLRYGQNLDNAILRLGRACDEDIECAGLLPDLPGTIKALAVRLDIEPVELKVEVEEEDGPTYYAMLDGGLFYDTLFKAFYKLNSFSRIPNVVVEASFDNFEPLSELIRENRFRRSDLNMATNYSVSCQDHGTVTRGAALRKDLEEYPDYRSFIERALFWNDVLCPLWLGTNLSHDHPIELQRPIPTLILTGAYDPTTPAAAGLALAEELPNAVITTYPLSGHGQLFQPNCAWREIIGFIYTYNVNSIHRPRCEARPKRLQFNFESSR